ncbi:glycosyltransferase [Aequorivita marisscotiae]|uniref:Glycosyltransferase n=1 Tax=Aequorivita marisscotiae TaxID=3040348 RepID=A0ABY8KWU8_9FLAO|nr:glycosyltransferase [Aequorivita sp. Ant34-E75]WGF93443.1 glycosyltransferase [Aequorivita sp. Ant34-E75]
MKILFVNPHLKMGGIANSLYNLLIELQKDSQFSIELVCFNPYFGEKFNQITNKVQVYSPFILKCLYINFTVAKTHLPWYQLAAYAIVKPISKILGDITSRKLAMRYLYNHWNRETNYDAAISFSNDIPKNNAEMGTNYFVQTSVTAKQKIAWIHNDLDKLGFTRKYILERYKNFDKIVSVSKSCKADFDRLAPEFSAKSYLVHNFLDPKVLIEKAGNSTPYSKKSDEIIFVTVARVENNQKRIDRILEIAKELKEKNYSFKWYLIGDGPDLEALKTQAKTNALKGYMVFKGFQQNPYPYIKYADCFVLSSAYEAQGMVLSEAIMLNTPVITTDFPAAKEFVIENVNGSIVANNTKALLQGVETLLKNPEKLTVLREQMTSQHTSSATNNSIAEFTGMLNT